MDCQWSNIDWFFLTPSLQWTSWKKHDMKSLLTVLSPFLSASLICDSDKARRVPQSAHPPPLLTQQPLQQRTSTGGYRWPAALCLCSPSSSIKDASSAVAPVRMRRAAGFYQITHTNLISLVTPVLHYKSTIRNLWNALRWGHLAELY